MLRLRWSLVLCLLAVAALETSAYAQDGRVGRPYRGLFASGTGNATHIVIATAGAGAGYDTDIGADLVGVSGVTGTPASSESGFLSQASGSLSYSRSSPGLSLGVSAGTNVRYYPTTSFSDKFLRSTQGNVTLSTLLRPRLSFSANAAVAVQPFTLTTMFFQPGAVPEGMPEVPILDLVITRDTYVSYDGGLGLSSQLGRRTSVSASYSYRTAQTTGEVSTFRLQTAGGQLTHGLGRNLNLRAGYTYGQIRYADGQFFPSHVIDAGLGYGRALSISRRTTLSFGTGSSGTTSGDDLFFTVTGNARISHEMGRTWSTWAGYDRGLTFNETYREPVLSHSVTAGISGLLGRRVQVGAMIGASKGSVGVKLTGNGFDGVYAGTSLGYALSRHANVAVSYSYYHYSFDEAAVLPVGALNALDRQGVRAVLNLWAPVFQSGRRSNASR